MAQDERRFERVGSDLIHEGRILTVTNDKFRFLSDGKVVEREIVHTSDAAGIVAVDETHLWLVRQPRETIDDPDSLELPAGRVDPGETPLVSAQRELAEEIGKVADTWTPLKMYYSSVGFTTEAVHLFLAEGLRDADGDHDSGEDERIEIVRWPLDDLEGLIAEVHDSKTLLGLLLYERARRART